MKCLKRWLMRSNTCPNCRSYIQPDVVEDRDFVPGEQ